MMHMLYHPEPSHPIKTFNKNVKSYIFTTKKKHSNIISIETKTFKINNKYEIFHLNKPLIEQ
jgi:hypothetical protein